MRISDWSSDVCSSDLDHLYMGNLDAIRDWGYAPEYVEGMWRMLQVDEPEDFVLATGGNYSVRDFLTVAFEHAGLNWENHVRFDERYQSEERRGGKECASTGRSRGSLYHSKKKK